MVPIREDQRVELDETFVGQLTLPSDSSGVVLGAATTATVTIRDDDSEYSETSLKLYSPTLASFPGLHSASCHLQQGRWKQGSWGGWGCPTFLALFMELRTFNMCRFCRVSVMTDQTSKPAIGTKQNMEGHKW